MVKLRRDAKTDAFIRKMRSIGRKQLTTIDSGVPERRIDLGEKTGQLRRGIKKENWQR